MKSFSLFALLILFATNVTAVQANTQNKKGMINVSSQFSVAETTNRLEKILSQKGMTIFKRVHHSQSAAQIGIQLRETELVIFGNPKIGSKLMQCQQSVAIDLPQKALIWKDSNNQVWLSYNDPEYLAQRHELTNCGPLIKKISKALAGISKAATQ